MSLEDVRIMAKGSVPKTNGLFCRTITKRPALLCNFRDTLGSFLIESENDMIIEWDKPVDYCLAFSSPIGILMLTASEMGLTGLYTPAHPRHGGLHPTKSKGPILAQTIQQLDRYFAGSNDGFTVPLDLWGTPFFRSVWYGLLTIPFGETRTYGQIAAQIGRPTAARAVGLANRENPLSIIVPCHRVVGTGGRLTGYRGGIETKEWLLSHEQQKKTQRTEMVPPHPL